jgi:glycosyltransferase involved in cell wall biosynthesis
VKILFVDEKDWVKKVPYTIHYLAEHLVKRGHQVFAIDYDDTWQKQRRFDLVARRRRRNVAKLDQACAVDVTSPSFIKVPGLSRLSTLATHYRAIASLIRGEAIDCVVAYGITNAIPALLAAKRHGVPILFHSIDMLAPLVPFKALERPAELIEQTLMRFSDCTLALTPVLAKRARRLGARAVAVIPNGVETERLRPGLDTAELRSELGLRDEQIIVFVGTLTKHVGLDVFLQYFATLRCEGVKFVVVGDDVVTSGRELQRAKALCRELAIEERVVFTGLQPAQRVPLYINLADICVSPFPPSKFSTFNIAMKVFEYMACGKPAVTFQLEGTKSLAPPGTAGVVYVDNHEEMCTTITRLLRNKEERNELGAAGRQIVEQYFSWDSVTHDLEQVLLDLRDGRLRTGVRR